MRIRSLHRAALHALVGAYALDALDEGDRSRFERHLARCDVCAQEVRGLRATTALLGSSVAAAPPQRMRARVLAVAAQARQQPPARAGAGPARQGTAGWLGRWVRLGWSGRRSRRGARGWLPRVAFGVGAASLAVAVALGVVAVAALHRLDRAEKRNSEVAAVLTSRDAVMMAAPVATGGTATVVMSHAKHMIVFSAQGLHPVTGARGYELWLIGPEGVRAAGMLPPPSNGMTAPMVAGGIGAGDTVGLTVEPARGSHRPTTKPVLMLPLSD